VQVDRKSDPPVCKIMDFHKEKYKKDTKEKERLKTKVFYTCSEFSIYFSAIGIRTVHIQLYFQSWASKLCNEYSFIIKCKLMLVGYSLVIPTLVMY
jgi:hypothetical protein